MRAILFRERASFETQVVNARRVDARARMVEVDDLAHIADADDWLLVRASDVNAFRSKAREYEDVRIESNGATPTSATYRGQPVPLTQLELGLLASLVRASGRPVGRDVLLRDCWNMRSAGDFAKIEAAVCRLRKKLCATTHLNVLMDRGIGYRLAPRASDEAARQQRGRRVLIAEPDMHLRRALVKHLRDFTAETATTVVRTERLLRERHYVAAFIATQLRDGDAYALLPIACPTMMMVDDDDGARRSIAAGATSCWQKLDDVNALRVFARRAADASPETREIVLPAR